MSDPRRPVPGVSVAVWRDGSVLLIRRGQAPYLNLWALPGGRVEFGETLAAAARREAREETGLEVEIAGQMDTAEILDKDPGGAVVNHFILAIFAGRCPTGEPVAGDDAAEARFVAPAEFASLTMTADTARIVARGPDA